MEAHEGPPAPERRAFLKKSCAVVIGGVAATIPIAAGIAIFADPLRRKGQAGEFVSIASLGAVPEDGAPAKFPVITRRVDVWTTSPLSPVGAVYLRRTSPKTVQALNVVCPHAGCFVDFIADKKSFLCPCHNSTFALDGKINDAKSPSPRALDELEVEIRNESEVWVKFQNFLAGVHDKIPI